MQQHLVIKAMLGTLGQMLLVYGVAPLMAGHARRARQRPGTHGPGSGEPGIGKTALVDAFQQQALAAVPGLRLARGQCLEGYDGMEAYYPSLLANTTMSNILSDTSCSCRLKRAACACRQPLVRSRGHGGRQWRATGGRALWKTCGSA
jgi:hypothetical protein